MEDVLLERTQLDTTQVGTIVQQQFAELSPVTVEYLGEGCDSAAFEVNGQWVFRFPKRADVEQQLAVESRILPLLGEQSPLRLPVFRFHGRPCKEYPYHFVGYRKLPGVPAIQVDSSTIRLETWAPVMGRFLSWLHRFPVGDAARLGVPQQEMRTLLEEVRADALDDFELLYQVTDTAPLASWRTFFARGCSQSGPTQLPVLAHRDLAAEHVLCDPTRREVVGIIDWSEIAISDRSVDLAGLFHWGGGSGMKSVLAAYEGPVDEDVLIRARFLAACRGVGDVAFGLETERREYIESGMRALDFCLGGDGRARHTV